MHTKVCIWKNVPLSTNTLALLPLVRLHKVAGDPEVRAQEEAQPKVLVHDGEGGAVRVDVAACLVGWG